MKERAMRPIASMLVWLSSFRLLAAAEPPDWLAVGAIHHAEVVEVGLKFAVPMDPATVGNPANYSVGGAEWRRIEFQHLNASVVISAIPASPADGFLLTVSNLRRADGALFPNRTLVIANPAMRWAEVGASQLGFESSVTPGPGGRFDLIGGGFQLWDRYDEAVFAHEEITGDFDRKVRVVFQEASSKYAKAGLMVREALDAGRGRPSDPSDPALAFSRYLQIHIAPLSAADGAPGLAEHQINLRLFPGGIGNPRFQPTENPPIQANGPPEYPNAWLRIRREGSVLTAYRGANGLDWTEQGRFDFAVADINGVAMPPLPGKLLVGPSYCPELGTLNPFTGLRRAFLAEFHDYGPSQPSADPPLLAVRRDPSGWALVWEGAATLQESPGLAPAEWRDLPWTSPHPLVPAGERRFFRLRVP
jgi:hypothetical protein